MLGFGRSQFVSRLFIDLCQINHMAAQQMAPIMQLVQRDIKSPVENCHTLKPRPPAIHGNSCKSPVSSLQTLGFSSLWPSPVSRLSNLRPPSQERYDGTIVRFNSTPQNSAPPQALLYEHFKQAVLANMRGAVQPRDLKFDPTDDRRRSCNVNFRRWG